MLKQALTIGATTVCPEEALFAAPQGARLEMSYRC